MISYKNRNSVRTNVKCWNFPAGEVGVKINCSPDINWTRVNEESFDLTATLRNSDEVMQLLMTVDALRRRWPSCEINAYLPYIPYARQDRVCAEGESLSAVVMANLINGCNFKSVTTLDPHSDVISALIKNVRVISQDRIALSHINSLDSFDYIIAPDAGATKKAKKLSEAICGIPVAVASKTRNMETGEISEYEFSADVKGRRVLVVDDLADGGYTFIRLGERLNELGASFKALYVTHGIFTKGVDVLTDIYDRVITTNSYNPDMVADQKLVVIDVY